MQAASFPESNHVLDKPPDMSREECDALSVWIGPANVKESDKSFPVVISCWKLTKEELEEINRTGRVWLYVWGQTMPPVSLAVACPFNREESNASR